jgi:hypothetical protein
MGEAHMTNHEFRCWLDGFLSLTDESSFNQHQLTLLKNHANLVKAISGELEQDIQLFLTCLDKKMQHVSHISIDDIRSIVR